MINNYQQDAGEEDDRDSGSLSILSPLSKGDQVSFRTFTPFLDIHKSYYKTIQENLSWMTERITATGYKEVFL